MNNYSLVCHELESTGCEVKRQRETAERKAKGWRMNVPNHVGALDYHSVVSRSSVFQA